MSKASPTVRSFIHKITLHLNPYLTVYAWQQKKMDINILNINFRQKENRAVKLGQFCIKLSDISAVALRQNINRNISSAKVSAFFICVIVKVNDS